MPDNVAITAGSGTTVGTDERTINAVAVQVQRVDEQGSTAVASAQVNVTNSATTVSAARDTRKRLTIINRQQRSIFVGPSGVTTSTGMEIPRGGGITLHTTALVAAITAAAAGGTEYTHVLEEYDA